MKWTPRRIEYLGFLIKVTAVGPVTLLQMRERYGARSYEYIGEFKDAGYVTCRKDSNDTFIEVTPKGRVAYVEARKQFPSENKKPTTPERGLCGKFYVGPRQIVSDEKRRWLYGGARYSSGGFREIVDKAPVGASTALHGYRGDSA